MYPDTCQQSKILSFQALGCEKNNVDRNYLNGLLEMATKNGYINPTWLTENFMEQALREGELDPEISVKHIDIRAATAFGDNYCSLMYRVAARFDRGLHNGFFPLQKPRSAIQRIWGHSCNGPWDGLGVHR
uniref:Uncharacterized protein n=1 Tax=Timema shepardi TaxID=629360 RepID=A0A7R9B1D8_TIMSH|nr:unnamed protein product [Timema shepardi]